MNFSYTEFITRNIGFVTEEQQNILKNTLVFVPGVGGMGGVLVDCLARVGVENFIIADIDFFEVSNLNRQIFSTMSFMGQDKAEVTKKCLQDINPNIKVTLYKGEWVTELDKILKEVDIVVNGCDDIKCTVQLMRKCKEFNITAIDAFAAMIPNVYVIKPESPRPEEVFNFPTRSLKYEDITKDIALQCLQKEIEHVLIHSSSANYIDINIAKEIIEGKRKRISFAPMVWITGCLMSYEVVRERLKKEGAPSVEGVFFNPWNLQVEKPKNALIKAIRKYFVKKYLKKI